jgi:hypothetical protein
MSEPEKCLSVGKNFSRREWLMLIVILLMLEAGALVSSHAFMSNQDVINYISFASTIASLLLAVLAIVYGFYQSESQKRTGDGIEIHLSKLSGAAEKLAVVSSDLSGNAEKIAGVTDELERLGGAVDLTHNKLSELAGGINTVNEKYDDINTTMGLFVKSNSNRGGANLPDEMEVTRKLLLRSEGNLIVMLTFSLHSVFKGDCTSLCAADEFGTVVAQAIVDSGWVEINALQSQGAVAAAFMFFEICGILRMVDKDEKYVGLTSESLELIKKSAEFLKKDKAGDPKLDKFEKTLDGIKVQKE